MTDARYGWCGGGGYGPPPEWSECVSRIWAFSPRTCETGIRGILLSGEEEAFFAEGAYFYRT